MAQCTYVIEVLLLDLSTFHMDCILCVLILSLELLLRMFQLVFVCCLWKSLWEIHACRNNATTYWRSCFADESL